MGFSVCPSCNHEQNLARHAPGGYHCLAEGLPCQEEEVHRVRGAPDCPEELRSPKGQAFRWNCQVGLHIITPCCQRHRHLLPDFCSCTKFVDLESEEFNNNHNSYQTLVG